MTAPKKESKMESKGNYFFVKKTEVKNNFTQIPNQIFSLEITTIEKLILIYLFSNAETFRITNYRIEKTLNSERRTVKKAMEKLKELKFITNVNEFTIEINISKIIEYTSNSTGSNLTGIEENIPVIQPASNSTGSNLTGISTGNSTGTLPVNQLVHTSNLTPIIPVELHNNNTNTIPNQKENKKKEQQEENFQVSQNSGSGFQVSSLVLDQYLKSIFFGENLNRKMVDLYLSQSQELKKELTYLEFEKLFIYNIQKICKLNQMNFNRDILIQMLNQDFNASVSFIKNSLKPADIKSFKVNEDKVNRQLQVFKL